MTFGEKLQRLRAREGLSQEALAELLGVSRQAVSKWERDETLPEGEKIIRISRQFRVTTDYLLKAEDGESGEGPRESGGRRVSWGWLPLALGAFTLVRMLPGLSSVLRLFLSVPPEERLSLGVLTVWYGPPLLLCAALIALGIAVLRQGRRRKK